MSLDLLDYEFMRLALVAAFFTGLAAPAIGTFMVQRRLALLGDGLGHVALTGVALGLLTGTAPVLTALVVAVLGAVVIEVLRTYTRTSGDVALAMLFYGGIAAGGATLNRYLFGSITTVTDTDVVVVSVLGVVVVGLCLLLSPQLFAVCQDVLDAHDQDLAGRHVVVSAGGTREFLDPVRYLGNRSSGLQGIAIAQAAVARGATVTLGFAAETGDENASVAGHGRAKLERKGCELLVVNDVSEGKVFGREDTEAVILAADGSEVPVPPGSKSRLAHTLWDEIVRRAGRQNPSR